MGLLCDMARHACVSCFMDTDCGANHACVVGTCEAFNPCKNSLDCPTGSVCNPSAGVCVGCVSSADCPSGQQCGGGVCRATCQSDKTCTAAGLLCNTGGGFCTECLSIVDCPAGAYCAGGVCKKGVCAPGTSACVGTSALTCAADALGYGPPVDCGPTSMCVESGTVAHCGGADAATGG